MVHAVLRRYAPRAAVVDLTHQIPRHDIRAGALTLWRAAPWLAPGVILAVVDPGVATSRRSVAIEVAGAGTILVGPDNGLLLPAALHLGPITDAVELAEDTPDGVEKPITGGATFAGRDVFAPAAGRAAAGVPVAELGRAIAPASLAGEAVPEATPTSGGIRASVLWVDHFGNAQLNVTPATAGPGPFRVRAGEGPAIVMRSVRSYEGIAPDELALVVDSYGHLSICCDRRSAADRLGLRPGDAVLLQPGP